MGDVGLKGGPMRSGVDMGVVGRCRSMMVCSGRSPASGFCWQLLAEAVVRGARICASAPAVVVLAMADRSAETSKQTPVAELI